MARKKDQYSLAAVGQDVGRAASKECKSSHSFYREAVGVLDGGERLRERERKCMACGAGQVLTGKTSR